MSSTSISVLLPSGGDLGSAAPAREELARYLESTGLGFGVVSLEPREGEGWGAMVRRAVADAHGGVIVVVDPDLPYGVRAIGDAVAMIESGAADVVFGTTQSGRDHRFAILRWMLVDLLPDPAVGLQAFSAEAARLVVGESKLAGRACTLEFAFLANKYGYRVEPLHVAIADAGRRPRAFSGASLGAVIAIRMTARRMGYRASRRCPVCFANEVWTAAQIPGNLVRACSRCKCRYLNQFTDEDAGRPVRRLLRSHAPAGEPAADVHSQTAREKSSARRLAAIRKQIPPGARLLEVGIRDGSFGVLASREFEYVGIEPSAPVARAARARGLEVYSGTLSRFVNTGPAFDAISLFHVFENIADPHDALGRLKDLLKPGGVLCLTTFDTEGLVYLLTERNRLAQAFRTHIILYSRSAIIELLEHSGFEIDSISPEFDYRDHRFLRHLVAARWPRLAKLVNSTLTLLPDPLLVGTGSIRIVAKRRAGSPFEMRPIRSAEATHAR